MKRLMILPAMAAVCLAAGAAQACSCYPPAPLEEQVKEREYIFTGIVESVEPDPETEHHVLATFTVTAYWVGEPGRTIRVSTHESSATCGSTFLEESKYLVFADHEATPVPTTGLCRGTGPVEFRRETIEALGEAVLVPVEAETWSGIKARYGPEE